MIRHVRVTEQVRFRAREPVTGTILLLRKLELVIPRGVFGVGGCVSCQLCPTLCDPVDCSPPSSSVHGILQVGILEWVAISFSRCSFWPRDWTQISCIEANALPSELLGKPRWLAVKNPPANAGDMRLGLDPWIGKMPWKRAWQPTPVVLPGESLGWRSLVGYSP